jgi:hypothetical protein
MDRSSRFTLLISLALSAAALAGCSRPPPARYVRASELGRSGPLVAGEPLVIEFEAGDTIPLHFSLDGAFVKSADDAPVIPLRVLRHFFLRIDKSGVTGSFDGKHFDDKPIRPGSFQVGFGASKGGPPEAHVAIRTPVPAE